MPHYRRTYITLKESFVIPPHQPEAKKVLRVTTSVRITKTTAIRKKVIFWGVVKSEAEYVAKTLGKSDPVYCASFEVTCSGFIPVRQARPDLVMDVEGEIEFENFELINPRAIAAFFLIRVRTGRSERASLLISNEVDGDAGGCPSPVRVQESATGKAALEIRRATVRSTWTGRNRY